MTLYFCKVPISPGWEENGRRRRVDGKIDPGPRRSTRAAAAERACPRLRFAARPIKFSRDLILWTGDSWMARVRADVLSEIVPDDIIVDMNLWDEDAFSSRL